MYIYIYIIKFPSSSEACEGLCSHTRTHKMKFLLEARFGVLEKFHEPWSFAFGLVPGRVWGNLAEWPLPREPNTP